MRVFGLTGGISTGKSTVVAMFRAHGASIVDADVVARAVVEPGQPAFDEIARRFSEVVIDGRLNRAKLGARIFRNVDDRMALNAIVHPRVREETTRQFQALERSGVSFVINDVPLLIENRLHESMNGVILVTAPRQVQRARLMARNQLTAAQADERIDAQMPLDEKRPYARWVIDNGGSLEATRMQVDQVWQQLLNAP
jgi:dephospho-CoA kinase